LVNGVPSEASSPDPLLRSFGIELSKRRLQRQWSLDDLAGRAQVSRLMLFNIEHGKSNPTLLMIAKIASAFHIEPSELVHAATKAIQQLDN
jgi:transcriptional regulator with XRE-family HTH domain